MAASGKAKRTRKGDFAAPLSLDAREIARADTETLATVQAQTASMGYVGSSVGLRETDALIAEERLSLRRKVAACIGIIAVLFYLSLGFMGAMGQYYPYAGAYAVYSPVEVTETIAARFSDFLGTVTHLWSPLPRATIVERYTGYWGIFYHAGVLAVTVVCAELLAVAGMLYQNVFKNPIAGPGMLGVSSGVTLGILLLVGLYGAAASGMTVQHYAFCYGFGALILTFVIAVGRKLSGKGKPFDIVTMLLVGSLLSSLIGAIVNYITLFVWDTEYYDYYYTIVQRLQVDISPVSWALLAIVSAAAFIPVWKNRFQLNALAFDEAEVRLFGLNMTRLRGLALICGAIMLLAAQVHLGMVSLVSLIVPFISRSVFGCEFRKQLVGNMCISPILLLVCRDIVDLVPFVGDGLAIGSAVCVVALPLVIVIMAGQMRGW